MEEPTSSFRPDPASTTQSLRVDPPRVTWSERLKKIFGPVATLVILLFTKLKFVLVAVLKLLPLILKTGGTMFLSVWIYALTWGWWYAVGFVLLIFVHECGHLVVAKRFGLKVSAPMFIPFMGAFIALKDAPKNAWMEACVGIGGPIFGALAAWACDGIFVATGNPLFRALAYSGFLLNLFNLAPIGFLDGGRIATALSPWLWILGLLIMGTLTVTSFMSGHFNLLLLLILVMSLPRVWSLFRSKTDEEKRYFEVTPMQRTTMALMYFGLVVALVVGMRLTHIVPRQY